MANVTGDFGIDVLGVMQQFTDLMNAKFPPARCDPREEVIMRYTTGLGRFSQDKRFITLRMVMTKLHGESDGWHEGVWEAMFSDPSALLTRPAAPAGPLDQPVGPVPDVAPMAHTKGIWTFGDGSSITAVGPALSQLMPMDDDSALFTVTCAQVITGGTGRFEGCRGLKTSLGGTWNVKNIFAQTDDVSFRAITLDTFRIIHADYVG